MLRMSDQDKKIVRDLVKQILSTNLAGYKVNCPVDIVDRVFCVIEKSYMKEYKHQIHTYSKQRINQLISRHIRLFWDLKKIGRSLTHKSGLIQSYSQLKNY